MAIENIIPEHIMRGLREKLGLQPDDMSKDRKINERTKAENFNEIMEWYGFGPSSNRIRSWIESLWHINLDEASLKKEQESKTNRS